MIEVEGRREAGEFYFREVEERDREDQRRERWDRIVGSRYNRWYRRVKRKGIPGHLKRG